MKRLIMTLALLFLLVPFAHAEMTDAQAKNEIKAWLDKDCSFGISLKFVNLAIDGFSHDIRQESAQDGSFHFVSDFRQWNHPAEYEASEKAEYFYRYEDGALACYMQMNGETQPKGVFTAEEEAALMASKQQVIGADKLLPIYMKDFKLDAQAETEGTKTYSFRIPLRFAIHTPSMLANAVNNAISFTGESALSRQSLDIYASFEVDADTLMPIRLSYDFDELKPYLFSDGALSGEFAFDTDLMTLTYEFDYDLQETIDVPEEFLN